MAFTYNSLDSLDFERLCADIVERIKGIPISTFAPGRDGGIDGVEFQCDDPEKPRIILQAKHYWASNYSSLRCSMGRDVNKLQSFRCLGLFGDEVREAAIACMDACLNSESLLLHEPMGYVCAVLAWILEGNQNRTGAIPQALCEYGRIEGLVRGARIPEDFGDLARLYELVCNSPLYGPLLSAWIERLFEVLYECVADYCTDNVNDIAFDSGYRPFAQDDDGVVQVDGSELEALRAYCVSVLDECVDDILGSIDSESYEAILQYVDEESLYASVEEAIRRYIALEEFDFMLEDDTVSSTYPFGERAVSEDEAIERLWDEFAGELES